MINVVLGLLAGVAAQPVVFRPAPPIMTTPADYQAALPPLPGGAVPAVRATANLPQLFSTNDYPAAARRYGQQGTVTFAVAIDPGGRVTACSITQGSGSASLDYATCSIIQRRARFTPARDIGGRAVEDRTTGRIRWVLPPRAALPFADQTIALVYTIDAAGAVTTCRTEGNVKLPAIGEPCWAMMPRARNMVAESGKTTVVASRELVLEQGVRIGGADAAEGVGRGPGETRRMLFALALEIDAAGTVTNCVGTDGGMDAERAEKACADALPSKFVALDQAAGNRSVRRAVRYWASYFRPID